MKHLIFDYETMGVDVFDCALVDLAYLFFDSDRFVTEPYTFSELVSSARRVKFDLKSQVQNYGFVVEQSVVEWWKGLPDYARKQAVPSHEDVSIDVGLDRFLTDVESERPSYWWTRNNTFDPPITLRLARVTGMKDRFTTALPHWKVRDTRTWIDAKFNFGAKNNFCPYEDESKWRQDFIEHISTHDVAADVLRLQRIAIEESK